MEFSKYQKKICSPSISQYLMSLLVVVAISFSGCSHKATVAEFPLKTADGFSESGSDSVAEKWWTTFNDEQLNQWVDSAMTKNFDLAMAWERLNAANALVKKQASGLFPTLSANAGANHSNYFNESQFENSFMLGLTTEYEIDVWGRIRTAADAEKFRAQATFFDYQATAISLSGQIVQTWFSLIEANNQLSLTTQQLETNNKVLTLLKNRFGTGQIKSVDILRQQQLLERSREQKIMAQTQVNLLEHQMAVLLGKSPVQFHPVVSNNLPKLPPLPNTGIPIDMITSRPDVRQAYYLLKAADKDLASAISNQYPRLTLSVSANSSSNNINQLFENWMYTLAGNILAPIFQGNARKAEVKRNKSIKAQRFNTYAQTSLVALQEVEDALMQEKNQQQRLMSIKKQADLAQKSYKQLNVSYINGASNYLDVLTALSNMQQLQQQLLQAKLELLEYRIALYKALAGGFTTHREINITQTN